ncbi:hypothetical protein KXD40_002375 [Peronospora effusa]|uniref:RING-type domain-containing protein n=1 Tax=Peronospora effusa TaxID=542832 RepID=A0A3M6VG00_9STRA|nr:hypothetical protein DD238_002505 [Peronospora effusa]UIZ26639.1 hypothetical protein KXD40_002375 [Peronospora effusa]
MYPIRNNNERIILTNRNRDTNLPINGSTLDNLLHDDEDDDEWDASDHFVLPRLVYHNAVVDDTSELTHQQEEIDLTVSSSEDEGGDTNAVGDSDDVIEIIEPLQTSDTIESTLFHRKRRRPRVVASENDVLGLKRQRSMDMVRSIESTTVGMRNNEMLQKFKSELKCTICLDVLEGITSTICGHIFCAECIRLAIRANGKCPLCQRRLHLKDIHPLFF